MRLKGFEKGIYLFKFESGGKVETRKVVKE